MATTALAGIAVAAQAGPAPVTTNSILIDAGTQGSVRLLRLTQNASHTNSAVSATAP